MGLLYLGLLDVGAALCPGAPLHIRATYHASFRLRMSLLRLLHHGFQSTNHVSFHLHMGLLRFLRHSVQSTYHASFRLRMGLPRLLHHGVQSTHRVSCRPYMGPLQLLCHSYIPPTPRASFHFHIDLLQLRAQGGHRQRNTSVYVGLFSLRICHLSRLYMVLFQSPCHKNHIPPNSRVSFRLYMGLLQLPCHPNRIPTTSHVSFRLHRSPPQ